MFATHHVTIITEILIMPKLSAETYEKVHKKRNLTLKKKTELNKQRFLELFFIKACSIGETCEAINIDRTTYRNWVRDDSEFEQKLSDIKERLIDRNSTAIMKAGYDIYEDVFDDKGNVVGKKLIKSGDWRALAKWMEAEAPHRGWGNTIDLKTNGVIHIAFKGKGAEMLEGDD